VFITKPFEDELLSSWLFRLSRINFTNLINIHNFLFKTKNLHTIDIDIYELSNNQLEEISMKTKYSIVDIKNLQLLKYESYLEEEFNSGARHRWITPINKHTTSNFYSCRYCPLCLKNEPYLRNLWRLLFINSCSKHSIYLHNFSPNCKKQISFNNKDTNQKIHMCFHCKYDLRESNIVKIKQQSIELTSQKKLFTIMKYGYVKCNPKMHQYAVQKCTT